MSKKEIIRIFTIEDSDENGNDITKIPTYEEAIGYWNSDPQTFNNSRLMEHFYYTYEFVLEELLTKYDLYSLFSCSYSIKNE